MPTPSPIQTDYTYDFMGRLLVVAVPGETFTYTYNSAGQPIGVRGQRGASNLSYASNIQYDAFGQRTRMTAGATIRYTYDPITRRLTNLDSTLGAAVQRLTYGYDFVGNVTSMANAVPLPASNASAVTPGPTSHTFTYDNLHQLKSASGLYTGVGSRGGRRYTLALQYDELGNLKNKNQTHTNKVANDGSLPVTVPATSYNVPYAYSTTSRPHAPTSIGTGTTIQNTTYDADGNQTALTGSFARTMVWDDENRLKSLTTGGMTSQFLYRSNGERAIQRNTSGSFHYANAFYVDRPLVQSVRHVMLGNQRIASVITAAGSSTGRTLFYLQDHLQSSAYTVDNNGALVQHNEYFPTGETWVDEVTSGQSRNRLPYMFNAKELDSTGLYYMSARYYDPRQSLWMSTDPAMRSYVGGRPSRGIQNPANLGVYSYSYNNPVTLRDPTGLNANTMKIEEVTVVGRTRAQQEADQAAADAKLRQQAVNVAGGVEAGSSAVTLVKATDLNKKSKALFDTLSDAAGTDPRWTRGFKTADAELDAVQAGILKHGKKFQAVGKAGTIAGGIGAVSSGIDAARHFSRGQYVEGALDSADVASEVIGKLGPVGAAFDMGYSIGTLAGQGLDQFEGGQKFLLWMGGGIVNALGIPVDEGGR